MTRTLAPLALTISWDPKRYDSPFTIHAAATGREAVLPFLAWGIALNLAVQGGWTPAGALLKVGQDDRTVGYSSGISGQRIVAADAKKLAKALASAIAEYPSLTERQRLERRHILQHGTQERAWLQTQWQARPGMEVAPFYLLRQAETRNAPTDAPRRGMAALAAFLGDGGDYYLNQGTPATWLHPALPVELVEILPGFAPFNLAGRAVQAGDTLLAPAADVVRLVRDGRARRVVETETANV